MQQYQQRLMPWILSWFNPVSQQWEPITRCRKPGDAQEQMKIRQQLQPDARFTVIFDGGKR